jgi:putative endonuclease
VAKHEGSYFAYIVASRSHTLYIGMTGDLLKRVFQHKQKTFEGFSAVYNCNRLVWFERYQGPRDAISREKQLKGWSRAKKIAFIEKTNPTWDDLSEGWYFVDPSCEGKANAGPSTPSSLREESAQDDNLKATAKTNADATANADAGPSTAQVAGNLLRSG